MSTSREVKYVRLYYRNTTVSKIKVNNELKYEYVIDYQLLEAYMNKEKNLSPSQGLNPSPPNTSQMLLPLSLLGIGTEND